MVWEQLLQSLRCQAEVLECSYRQPKPTGSLEDRQQQPLYVLFGSCVSCVERTLNVDTRRLLKTSVILWTQVTVS